jgi:hypothetical protein
MSSYLEDYGTSEERRAKRTRLIKLWSISFFSTVLVGLVFYAVFKNHSEQQQAKAFVASLIAQDYQSAYRMWGCTDANPCRDYPFSRFMDDWGPKSTHADESSAHIGLSQSCGSGVVIRLDYKNAQQPVPLWVERKTKQISYAPWPECPGRHLHVGAWLRSLFN